MNRFAQFTKKVEDERQYQANKWGDGTEASLDAMDDQENNLNDFVAYIAKHSTKWFTGGFPPYTPLTLEEFQKQMVKVAALAYAAHEFAERNR